jgi:hypothetical protein
MAILLSYLQGEGAVNGKPFIEEYHGIETTVNRDQFGNDEHETFTSFPLSPCQAF